MEEDDEDCGQDFTGMLKCVLLSHQACYCRVGVVLIPHWCCSADSQAEFENKSCLKLEKHLDSKDLRHFPQPNPKLLSNCNFCTYPIITTINGQIDRRKAMR